MPYRRAATFRRQRETHIMTMSVAPAGPGWRSFTIERQLDRIAAPAICAALRSAAEREETNLLIDLEAVDAADALGIAEFIGALRSVHAEHPRVRLAVLAHRLLADTLEHDLPRGTAEVYRERMTAYGAIAAQAAA
jgi:hypothetical protein